MTVKARDGRWTRAMVSRPLFAQALSNGAADGEQRGSFSLGRAEGYMGRSRVGV